MEKRRSLGIMCMWWSSKIVVLGLEQCSNLINIVFRSAEKVLVGCRHVD